MSIYVSSQGLEETQLARSPIIRYQPGKLTVMLLMEPPMLRSPSKANFFITNVFISYHHLPLDPHRYHRKIGFTIWKSTLMPFFVSPPLSTRLSIRLPWRR